MRRSPCRHSDRDSARGVDSGAKWALIPPPPRSAPGRTPPGAADSQPSTPTRHPPAGRPGPPAPPGSARPPRAPSSRPRTAPASRARWAAPVDQTAAAHSRSSLPPGAQNREPDRDGDGDEEEAQRGAVTGEIEPRDAEQQAAPREQQQRRPDHPDPEHPPEAIQHPAAREKRHGEHPEQPARRARKKQARPNSRPSKSKMPSSTACV